jgi:hypothetical protein
LHEPQHAVDISSAWCNVTRSVPLDYDTVRSGRWLQTFRRNTLQPTCAAEGMPLVIPYQTARYHHSKTTIWTNITAKPSN